MSGNKLDLGKPPLFFNPPEIQYGMARAFAYGEQKYGRWNWMKGLEASRLLAACLRHLLAWFWECTWDAESNLSHLDHAAASLAMLMENVTRKPELDDRPIKKAPEVGAEDLNDKDPLQVELPKLHLPHDKFVKCFALEPVQFSWDDGKYI
jgi:hypothetical protein